MVSYNAKDSLIVVLCCLWIEFYYYTSLWVGLYGPFCLWEWENVSFVVEELESCGLVTIVDNVEQSVSSWSKLYLTKVDRFTWKAYIRAVSLPLNWKVQLITTQYLDTVMCAWELSNNLWLISDSYFAGAAWHNGSSCLTQREWIVFAIVINTFNCEDWLHLWVVSKLNILSEGFSYCERFKIKFFMWKVHIWKFANTTHFQHFLCRFITFLEFKDCSRENNLSFDRFEVNFDLLFLTWSQHASCGLNLECCVIFISDDLKLK